MGSEAFGFETQMNVAKDSVEIYYDLIAEEHRNAHYSGNIVGMVTGGIVYRIVFSFFHCRDSCSCGKHLSVFCSQTTCK